MSAFGQYIPSENEDILHRRFNIYCNCLRRYTASANEVYLHFQRSRINVAGLANCGHSFYFSHTAMDLIQVPGSSIIVRIVSVSFRQLLALTQL